MEDTGCQEEFSTEKILVKDSDKGIVLRFSLDLQIPFDYN